LNFYTIHAAIVSPFQKNCFVATEKSLRICKIFIQLRAKFPLGFYCMEIISCRIAFQLKKYLFKSCCIKLIFNNFPPRSFPLLYLLAINTCRGIQFICHGNACTPINTVKHYNAIMINILFEEYMCTFH